MKFDTVMPTWLNDRAFSEFLLSRPLVCHDPSLAVRRSVAVMWSATRSACAAIVSAGIHRRRRGKERGVHDEQVSTSCVRQNGSSTDVARIGAEAQRAALVRRVLAACASASTTTQKPSRRRIRFVSSTSRSCARRCSAGSAAGCGRRASTRDAIVVARQILRHRQPVDAARHPRS